MKIILINDNALQKICAIDCYQKDDKMSIEINLRPYKLAPLDYTVAVSRLQPFSVSLRKPEDSTISSLTAPQGP